MRPAWSLPYCAVISAVGWALFAAIQPVGILAYIIILTRGGRRDAWGFVVGWVLCACVVAVLTVAVAGGVHQHSADVIGSAGWVQIALGLAALALLAARRVTRGRTTPTAADEPEAPARRRKAGPVGAAVVATLAQGWPVIAAAVAGVLGATDAGPGRLLGVALVIAVSSSTYLVAQTLSGRYPGRTEARLQALRRRIEADRETAVDVVLLVAGLWLVVNGVVAQLAT